MKYLMQGGKLYACGLPQSSINKQTCAPKSPGSSGQPCAPERSGNSRQPYGAGSSENSQQPYEAGTTGSSQQVCGPEKAAGVALTGSLKGARAREQLYEAGRPGSPLAWIEGSFYGREKSIFSSDGKLVLQAKVEESEPESWVRDLRTTKYLLVNQSGVTLAQGQPGYDAEDDPAKVGWPVCRMPLADKVDLQLSQGSYQLQMVNTQNYVLKDAQDQVELSIMHRGFRGGWLLDTVKPFAAELLCGVFIFCRYLEQENEFITV